MKRIGLTYDLKTDFKIKSDDPPDAGAEYDHPETVDIISSAIESQGFQVKRIGNVASLLKMINNLDDIDIVFNISEGFAGRNRESQVPMLLEMAGIPFVGADALTQALTLDKVMAKKIFIAEGIPTPKYFYTNSIDNLIDTDHMNFPLIVKPRFEGSSKGLEESSRVENTQALKKQIRHIIDTYKQPALVEEFIFGQEFTVAVVGNAPARVMPIVQIKIDGNLQVNDKFYTFERIDSDTIEYICPASIDEDLEKEISALALRAYNAVDCRDFGRVDFRVDKQGNPYVLEVNPLPSLSVADVFPLLAKEIGITYEQMLGKILDSALQRYNLKK